jgi:hypothetical protein
VGLDFTTCTGDIEEIIKQTFRWGFAIVKHDYDGESERQRSSDEVSGDSLAAPVVEPLAA